MDEQRWRRIDTIFKSALELPTAERAAFLEAACAGDPSLRREVESLIDHERAEDFLDSPAVEEAARLLAAGRERSLEGQTVGPYKLLERIGAGGMGEVYSALHQRTARKVALKLLPARFTGDEQRVRRFRQEAQAVLALNHPNIVTVYDIEQVGETHVIASEFIEGETLRARARRDPLKLTEALDIAAQTAAALEAAHKAGVVHRDIKPENIMLRPDGYVKVLDFGLAKLVERRPAADSALPTAAAVNTDPGVVMGTVGYMSPEQARAESVDERTDIWSLGVVLYEMVTGVLPFKGKTSTDVMASILHDEPPALRRRAPEAPEALEWIVAKTLIKERDGRYQTARELLTDLKRLKQRLEFEAASEHDGAQAAEAGAHSTRAGAAHARTDEQPATTVGERATTRASSSAEYIVEEIRRHRLAASAVLAVALLAVAGAGVGLYKLLRRQSVPFQAMRVTRLSDTTHAVDAAVSPKGDFVAFVKEEGGRQSLWLRQASAQSSVQIAPPAEGVRYAAPVFSRAGDYVYYLKSERPGPRANLYSTPTLGGGEKQLVEDVSTNDSKNNFGLSPDGKRVAFVRLDENLGRSLVVADLEGGGERTLLAPRLPKFVAGAQWSPDGKTVATIAGSFDEKGAPGGDREVVGVRVEDGSEVRIPNQKWSVVRGVTWMPDASGLVVSASVKGGPLQLWHLSYPDGATSRITNDLSDYWGASVAADSPSLVAVQDNQRLNIWTATPGKDSWGLAQLTEGEGRHDGEFGVSWTADGRVVYSSMAGGESDIWVVGADGRQKQLTSGGGVNTFPTASPDGRYIVFNSDRSGAACLWRMDADGSHPKPLTTEGGFAWFAPDGRWVYYYQVGTLFKIPVEGGTPARIPTPEKDLATGPVLSPDGRFIACNYLVRGPGAQFRLAVIPAEGGAPVRIFDAHTFPIKPLRWNADGSAILYTDRRGGVGNVWSQPLDGSPPTQVTSFTSDDIYYFDLARDGRLVLSRGGSTSSVVMLSDFK
jgi:eukaryotic-like serine/threonine-protein kinase